MTHWQARVNRQGNSSLVCRPVVPVPLRKRGAPSEVAAGVTALQKLALDLVPIGEWAANLDSIAVEIGLIYWSSDLVSGISTPLWVREISFAVLH